MKVIIYKSSLAHFIEKWPDEPKKSAYEDGPDEPGIMPYLNPEYYDAIEIYNFLKEQAIESAIPVRQEDKFKIDNAIWLALASNYIEPKKFPVNLFPYPLPDGIEMEINEYVLLYGNTQFERVWKIVNPLNKYAKSVGREKFARIVEKPIRKRIGVLSNVEKAIAESKKVTKESEVRQTCTECGHDDYPCANGFGINPKCPYVKSKPAERIIPPPAINENGTVIQFLRGERSFEGVWFGDKHPTRGGPFWWRSVLLDYLTPEPDQETHIKTKEALKDLLEVILTIGDMATTDTTEAWLNNAIDNAEKVLGE